MSLQRPQDAARAFIDAFNSGDLDAVIAVYEPQATLVPQQGQVASGAPAIRQALGGFLALQGRMKGEVTHAVLAGDLALVAGAWTLDGSGPDGKPVSLSGRSTDVVRRQPDGAWRLVIDVPFGID
jgi:uncharacterized protein (TIGR02246 family)